MPSPEEFSCTCDTGLGWVFGCSRTGAAHIRAGRPCEDAYALWSGSSGAQPCIAFAVADGHGDPRHDQSRTGAALAVDAAISELIPFFRSYAEEGVPPQQLRAGFKTDFPRRVTRVLGVNSSCRTPAADASPAPGSACCRARPALFPVRDDAYCCTCRTRQRPCRPDRRW